MRGLPGDSESGEIPIMPNNSFKPTPLRDARLNSGVCAGHGTELTGCPPQRIRRGGEVPVPGRSRAEGKEKGKGVVVRWGLEEAQSESAERRTGTGYEVWHTQDELARDNEVLHLRKVCFINPAFTRGRFCVLLREI